MSTIEVDPGIRTMLDLLAGMGAVDFAEIGAPAAREIFRTMRFPAAEIPLDQVADRDVPGPAGPVPVRIYRPFGATDPGVLVWYHGGGFVIGDLDTTDQICRELTSEAGCVVVSVSKAAAELARALSPISAS